MNALNKPVGLDATTLLAAGAGAVVLGGAAWVLTRSTGASNQVGAGSTLLFGLFGACAAAAAIAVSRRVPVPAEDEEDCAEGAEDRRSDLHEITNVAEYLRAHLGGKVTAYLSGVDDPLLVDRWASGEWMPEVLTQSRLVGAYEAAKCIVEAYDGETAQAWFIGENERLDDEAPASVLRQGNGPADWRFLVPAAREFVETAR